MKAFLSVIGLLLSVSSSYAIPSGYIFEVHEVSFKRAPSILGHASSTEITIEIPKLNATQASLVTFLSYEIGKYNNVGAGSKVVPQKPKLFLPHQLLVNNNYLICAYIRKINTGCFSVKGNRAGVVELRDHPKSEAFATLSYSIKDASVTPIDKSDSYNAKDLYLADILEVTFLDDQTSAADYAERRSIAFKFTDGQNRKVVYAGDPRGASGVSDLFPMLMSNSQENSLINFELPLSIQNTWVRIELIEPYHDCNSVDCGDYLRTLATLDLDIPSTIKALKNYPNRAYNLLLDQKKSMQLRFDLYKVSARD